MGVYCVYWVKRKGHSDYYKEGYVGISKHPQKRYKEHKKRKRSSSIVHNAINKYDDIEMVILHENLSIEKAKEIEKNLRPLENIGWNIAEGGGVPPNMKGIKRPEHSEKMKGPNNPFYGNKHSEETKLFLSVSKSGDRNPFYNTKRSSHSDKMKLLKGKNYPKFRGYFITPTGKFDSCADARENLSLSATSIYNYCIVLNDNKITKLSYKKSKYLRRNYDESIIGKTYKEIGFGFEHV